MIILIALNAVYYTIINIISIIVIIAVFYVISATLASFVFIKGS